MKVDQSLIPMEVKRAMCAAWARRNNSDAPEKHMADLAVAMLDTWPGKASLFLPNSPGSSIGELVLYLPVEVRDD